MKIFLGLSIRACGVERAFGSLVFSALQSNIATAPSAGVTSTQSQIANEFISSAVTNLSNPIMNNFLLISNCTITASTLPRKLKLD